MSRPDSTSSAIAEVLRQFDGVRLALLFGSRAVGRAREDSDYDIALDCSDTDLTQVAARLSDALGAEVDVVRLSDAGVPLLRELLRDATIVFESSPGRGAFWRSRALAQLETDGPWYDRMRDAWIAEVAEHGLGHGSAQS